MRQVIERKENHKKRKDKALICYKSASKIRLHIFFFSSYFLCIYRFFRIFVPALSPEGTMRDKKLSPEDKNEISVLCNGSKTVPRG